MLSPSGCLAEAFFAIIALIETNDRLEGLPVWDQQTTVGHNGTARFGINAVINCILGMHASKHPAPAPITILNPDPALKKRLRVRTAQYGQSMEAEARYILQTVLAQQEAPAARHLYDRVRARFAPLGGFDLELPPREPMREPPRLD